MMTPSPSTMPTGLQVWLRAATRGLGQEGRQRVTEEVRDHYAQAFQDGVRSGLTKAPAKARALATLGSPKAARRQYRQKYLTQAEELTLGRIANIRQSRLTSLAFVVYAVIFGPLLLAAFAVAFANRGAAIIMIVFPVLAAGCLAVFLLWRATMRHVGVTSALWMRAGLFNVLLLAMLAFLDARTIISAYFPEYGQSFQGEADLWFDFIVDQIEGVCIIYVLVSNTISFMRLRAKLIRRTGAEG